MRSRVKIEDGYIPDTWNLISKLCIYSTLKNNHKNQQFNLKHTMNICILRSSDIILNSMQKHHKQISTILSKCLLSQPKNVKFYYVPLHKTLHKEFQVLIMFIKFLEWCSTIQQHILSSYFITWARNLQEACMSTAYSCILPFIISISLLPASRSTTLDPLIFWNTNGFICMLIHMSIAIT